MSEMKQKSIFALSLAGKLALVNGNFWIILVLLARNGSLERLPEFLKVVVSAVMIFMAIPFGCIAVIPATGGTDIRGIIFVAICLGLNAIAWGYGLAWIFKIIRNHFFRPRPAEFPPRNT